MSGTGEPDDRSRLERALQVFIRWRAAGSQEPAGVLLERHEDLRDLLGPMIEGQDDDPADEALPADPVRGRLLGDFRLVREIGRGGMGVVYEAVQVSLNRRVALKVLPAHLTLSPMAIARFQREAETAARLRHPGIVAIHAVSSHGDLHWFVMDLVEGAPLDAVLRGLAQLDRHALRGTSIRAAIGGEPADGDEDAAAWGRGYVETIVSLVTQVADALDHAHRAGVVHRDVKPSNIIVRPDGRAILTDFGLAREEGLPSLTVTGDFAGTPHYVAPEQAEPRPGGLDARADVFSLGATLYEALTFERAFAGSTTREVLARVVGTDPRDPQKVNPELASDLSAVVMKALEKDRARRYATAADFAADLRSFLGYRPVRARAVSRGTRLWRWARRNPLVSGLAASLVVVGIGGFVAIVLKNAELAASLAGLRRMSDVRLVEQYVGNRFDVRGHDESHAPQLDAWLEVARPLAARRPLHEARLSALRAAALAYEDRDRETERSRHPMAGHLDSLRAEVADLPGRIEAAPEDLRPDLVQRLEVARRRIPEIEADLAVRRTWRFAESADQWEHDTLVDLLRLLDDLTDPVKGSLPAVERWRKFVGEVRARTTVEPRALWERTIAGIADPAVSPRYGGLGITPQLGLLPLGPDPRSRLQEFAHVLSGTVPDRDADGRLRMTPGTCIVLVLLPGGTSRLGSRPPGEPGSAGPHLDPWSTDKEWPVHEVELAPFFMGKFEVTAGQLRRATGLVRSAIGQSRFPERPDLEVDLLPVETITHVEAEGALAAIGLRLPTEAQWEHAARGGTGSPWYPGEDPLALATHGNVADRQKLQVDNRRPGDGHPGWALDDGWALVAPVGSYAGNPFGLHDVIGNVAELVLDSPAVYEVAGRQGDGLREGGDARFRIIRGGSFTALPTQCRSASREQFPRDTRLTNTGMRAARSLDPR